MSGCYGEIRGYVFRDVEAKVSKAGGRYASATVKVRDNDQNVFWKVMAFKGHVDELLGFKDGDGVSVRGFVKAEVWTPQGKEPRVSLSLMANEIAPWQPGKAGSSHRPRDDAPRPPAGQPADYRARQGRERTLSEMAANGGGRYMPARGHAGLDDDVPFGPEWR